MIGTLAERARSRWGGGGGERLGVDGKDNQRIQFLDSITRARQCSAKYVFYTIFYNDSPALIIPSFLVLKEIGPRQHDMRISYRKRANGQR